MVKHLLKITFSVLLLILFTASVPNTGDKIQPLLYEKGNEFYKNGNFQSALESFNSAISEGEIFSQRYPWIQFKIGFCQFKTSQYLEAIRTFEENYSKLSTVKDYISYFALVSKLALKDTLATISHLNNFISSFPDSPLMPLVDSLAAHLYFAREDYNSAVYFYKRQLKHPYFDRGEIYGRLIQISRELGQVGALEDDAFKILKKYPYHPQADFAYQEILKVLGSKISERDFEKLYDYLIKTNQFDKAERLIRFQERSSGENELTQWCRIEIKYKKKKYQLAMDDCINQRDTFKNLRYLRQIDLTIARCYLRMGFTKKSIAAYAEFQKRYPRDFLSPEVLWKIAWLYEGLGNVGMARQYYEKLISIYPNSDFVSESRFRVGLGFYSQGKYTFARAIWKKYLLQVKSRYEKPRFEYWIAKTYFKEKDFPNYLKELSILSETPFNSYYNLKAYILTIDNTPNHQKMDSLLWELHHEQMSFLGDHLQSMERAFIVQDILGDKYARYELNSIQNGARRTVWQYTFAMAELQELLGNFGKSFRLYRNVYNRNFSGKEWEEWIFLFKKLYPLYYHNYVQHYSQNRNLIPALIWAIIKKESAFETEIVSFANAYGLMQIIPPTAKEITRELGLEFRDARKLYVPDFNINLGTFYLSELLKRYNWNFYYALAAYNAGPHRVDRWQKTVQTDDDDFFMENIEFSETRKYVRMVMQYYWTYFLLLNPQGIPEDVISFPQRLAREPWYHELKGIR
jgi:soluble lytic murein transglycosylase